MQTLSRAALALPADADGPLRSSSAARLGLLSSDDEAQENLLAQGQLFFLLLGALGAGALLTHMISRLLAARIHATVAAAARAEAESLASGGAVVMN